MTSLPTLCLFSPLPPAWSGVADYTELLLPTLITRWHVVVFIPDDDPEPGPVPEGVEVYRARTWDYYAKSGPIDRLLLSLGNSKFHLDVPRVAARYGGLVLAHDIRMTALQCLLGARADDPHYLSKIIADRHGRHLGEEIAAMERLVPLSTSFQAVRDRIEQANVYLLGRSIRGADAVAVHSRFAARLAALDLFEAPIPIHRVSFGNPDVRPAPAKRPTGVISTFGMVGKEKAPGQLVEALARVRTAIPDASLRFVGPKPGSELADHLTGMASRLGLDGAVHFVGRLERGPYEAEIEHATLAIQTRSSINGECSGAAADCMAGALPTVVTRVGAQAELPADSVLHVPPRIDGIELGNLLIPLLQDPAEQRRLGLAGQAHAADHSFQRAAHELSDLLEGIVPRVVRERGARRNSS